MGCRRWCFFSTGVFAKRNTYGGVEGRERSDERVGSSRGQASLWKKWEARGEAGVGSRGVRGGE